MPYSRFFFHFKPINSINSFRAWALQNYHIFISFFSLDVNNFADFAYCVFILTLFCSATGLIFGSPLNNEMLIYALTFLYGVAYTGNQISLMGLFKFDASLMCYIYGAIDTILFGKYFFVLLYCSSLLLFFYLIKGPNCRYWRDRNW